MVGRSVLRNNKVGAGLVAGPEFKVINWQGGVGGGGTGKPSGAARIEGTGDKGLNLKTVAN